MFLPPVEQTHCLLQDTLMQLLNEESEETTVDSRVILDNRHFHQ
jgi:hypothetical protein